MTMLVRDLGRSLLPACDANDAREGFFASEAAVAGLGGLATDLL